MDLPTLLLVDDTLRLRPISEADYLLALPWYQDMDVLKGTGDPARTEPYDQETVDSMYSYLSKIGECYIIEILERNSWRPIGDVTLAADTMPIVIGDKRYWGQGIGTRVIKALLDRARTLGFEKITLKEIYHDNYRSLRLYTACGFKPIANTPQGVVFEIELGEQP